MKTCAKCGFEKPFEEFHRRSASKDGRQPRCKICTKEKTDQWYRENGDRARAYHREYDRKNRKRIKARQYGLTEEELDLMFENQQGRCGICDRLVGDSKLQVDHCHTEGHVRKLLCLQCNTGLGNFRDDPDLLRLAIRYLEEYKSL